MKLTSLFTLYAKRYLPFLITTILVFFWWVLETMEQNYAFHFDGINRKELNGALSKIFWIKMPFYVVVSNSIMFLFIMFLRKEKILLIAFSIVIFYFSGLLVISKVCSIYYYTVFKNQNVPEGIVLRPLKQAGVSICPILTEHITDKKFNSRIYAISAIEMYEYDGATKTLSSILNDSTESESIRASVYSALLTINSDKSKMSIKKFNSSKDSLSSAIVDLGKKFYRSKDYSVVF